MIKLVRCDDRMIHGQCIVRVLSDFKINCIIGVDDFTAGNPVLKNIYKMAIPPQIRGGIYTTEEAIAEIPPCITGAENTLVLVKAPQTALKLFQAVGGLPKELNIGPMSSRKNAKKVMSYAYLTDEEVKAVNDLTGMGIRVYFNQTIDQKTEEWESVKGSMK